MNAVEIEEAITNLAEQEFDSAIFPYAFLEAFGNKPNTIKRLKSTKGSSNSSDIEGGVLQRSNIHILMCEEGEVTNSLNQLKQSPATTKAKAKFILATDGINLEAEDLNSGETLACEYRDFPNHFGFFLPLAGISTVKQIRNNPIDIQATGRLNRLYIELLKENEDWATEARRPDMNHFMARLIFCFFAEDTDIFNGDNLFTATIEQMSGSRDNNTEYVIGELFRAMDIELKSRVTANLPRWADCFPYVNGGLFAGGKDVPKFSRIARSYLLHAGNLDWKAINPDIFGSMIQAVTDDSERGSLGMHYTSVPNILKVLNPLFLDDLLEQLENASDNRRKLLNLRKRISNIRVFDPACGSGNFLVIAYKQMRAIEYEINKRRNEIYQKSEIPLTNFRGIEIKNFSAEIARLALIIAEYQCDVIYRGQQDALAEFLPLNAMNWITCDNALRVDWLSVCPPTGKQVKQIGDDLFSASTEIVDVDFENEGGETYICGNPPYIGDKFQTTEQKQDLRSLSRSKQSSKAIDYVTGWFWKASQYLENRDEGAFAFVSTNSICQGVQVPLIWPPMLDKGQEIFFAHKDFNWSNNASKNANVICVIIGITYNKTNCKYLYTDEHKKLASNINPYLIEAPTIIVKKHSEPISGLPVMYAGNIPRDKGNLMLSPKEKDELLMNYPQSKTLIRRIQGSRELINGIQRYCLWITDDQLSLAKSIEPINARLCNITEYRRTGSERGKLGIDSPHRFERTITGRFHQLIVPRVSSQRRGYLPVDYTKATIIVSDAAQAIYDAPLNILSILCSRLHIAWIAVTAGRMKSDFRYSTGVCYNSFPTPIFTEKNKSDLTRCAEDILLAREAHFPATIADLYDPENMPENLRHAHERNDEVLERIYIGRKFKNDTERLEKLFALYTKMTAPEKTTQQGAKV